MLLPLVKQRVGSPDSFLVPSLDLRNSVAAHCGHFYSSAPAAIFFWPSTWHCLPLGWLETLRLSGNFGHLLSVCLTARSLWFFVGLAAPKEVLQPASCTYRNPSQVEPPSWEATSNVVWPTMTGFHRKTSSIRLKGVLHKASDLTQSIAGAHTPTSISIVVFSSSLAI